ncbi:hypothetical protein CONLIGDRAFT_80558 [Coniochaeta ligniaria NRRL 30616]|uniref:Uncharacterized protein n=1 Tax=Coniochaeta ligniaria NRRL 30616 TaxID=1408157 RepID=A0A1J7J7B9_9PEZI|nr:hypothetical protein CONLIGDRAFT_80558 [Coniochaeta ligniaria NRRL 30616]
MSIPKVHRSPHCHAYSQRNMSHSASAHCIKNFYSSNQLVIPVTVGTQCKGLDCHQRYQEDRDIRRRPEAVTRNCNPKNAISPGSARWPLVLRPKSHVYEYNENVRKPPGRLKLQDVVQSGKRMRKSICCRRVRGLVSETFPCPVRDRPVKTAICRSIKA